MIHIVKGFGIVNKAEIDVFLELSCFFDDPADVGSLISGSSAFSKSSLNIWKFMVHVLLKPGLENFKHYFASMWDECSCVVAWAFFGIVSLVAHTVNHLPAVRATRVQSLGWEDPLEKEMATTQYSSLENPMVVESGRLQSMGSQRVGHDWSDLAYTLVFTYNCLF